MAVPSPKPIVLLADHVFQEEVCLASGQGSSGDHEENGSFSSELDEILGGAVLDTFHETSGQIRVVLCNQDVPGGVGRERHRSGASGGQRRENIQPSASDDRVVRKLALIAFRVQADDAAGSSALDGEVILTTNHVLGAIEFRAQPDSPRKSRSANMELSVQELFGIQSN